MTAPSVPEAPKLTPERAQQELARLTAIIKDNPNLHFLEPRVVKCVEVGTQDSATFLSFYRLISQSLSEELMQQKDKIRELETSLASDKKNFAQNEMEAALAEASEVVNRATGQPAAVPAPTSGHEAPPEVVNSAQVEELQKRLDQAEVQRERLLQDIQNIRNRAKTDIEVRAFKAVEKFTQSLLPALDAFHQAMPSLQNATDTVSIVTGIEMIHEQLESALTQAGLQKMVVVGQPFDPHLHEAIGEVQTGDVPDDHIFDELQPGYLFGERLIRAAVVRLARNDGSVAPSPQQSAPEPTPLAPEAATAEPQSPIPTATPAATEAPPAAQPAPEAVAPPPDPVSEVSIATDGPVSPPPVPEMEIEATPPAEASAPPTPEAPAPASDAPATPVPEAIAETEAPAPAPPEEAPPQDPPAPAAPVEAPPEVSESEQADRPTQSLEPDQQPPAD